MKKLFMLAGLVGVVAGARPLSAQVVDTTATPDTTKKPDSTRSINAAKKADTTVGRRDTTPAAVVAPTSLKSVGKVDGPVRLSADLSERQLTVVAGNGAIRTFAVAIGTKAYPTPTGTFRIKRIVWNPSWVPPDSKWAKGKKAKGPGEPGNPMKVAKIFFQEPDYYIHGTAAVNSLGTADSHGCLRMSPDEVAELAQFLMLNGGQAREEGWFSRVLHFRYRTHTITLSNPVLLTISQ